MLDVSNRVERWLPVVGASRYEVSTYGRVRKGSKICRQTNHATGYKVVSVVDDDGYSSQKHVHRIVHEAHSGIPRLPGMCVCHNDGNKLNNYADNLRWDTHAGNMKDIAKHGTWRAGKRITRRESLAIRKMSKQGLSGRRIAKILNRCASTIAEFLKRQKGKKPAPKKMLLTLVHPPGKKVWWVEK